MENLTRKSKSKNYVQLAKRLVNLQKEGKDCEAQIVFNNLPDSYVKKSVLNTIRLLHEDFFCNIFQLKSITC